MLSFSSIKTGENPERRETYFRVQTSKCWYQVNVVGNSLVRVLGPGVDETYDLDECDLPEDVTVEGIALIAVIMFEEQE